MSLVGQGPPLPSSKMLLISVSETQHFISGVEYFCGSFSGSTVTASASANELSRRLDIEFQSSAQTSTCAVVPSHNDGDDVDVTPRITERCVLPVIHPNWDTEPLSYYQREHGCNEYKVSNGKWMRNDSIWTMRSLFHNNSKFLVKIIRGQGRSGSKAAHKDITQAQAAQQH
ncbi:hypothetical protein C5167_000622 [Papaver somniferum]|uniref:Uncharacterized protein n=1 Tax=Papaver somniferum TaxID=3469 RepID=A0A4Y7KUD7_PAPSO|nr:hypothetical protein C5167_000622 [Papaver somniferum]